MKEKQVKEITSRDDDFAQWYTDICLKAELIDYSSIKGCMIIRPYGYAIWENIQKELDRKFKETGHQNVCMPLFISESLLNKEKDHIEGFAPEVAWVTHGGEEKLSERLCVRPTSETLFCEHYANIVKSYRDLPKLYNQWCSVVRWEKTTRPFLRSREFLWQEGHTVHATSAEAKEETLKMLNIYADFCEEVLAIPVVKGEKTEKEKFAGAENTYTIEALMYNGVALQSATSHYFGDHFAKVFNMTFVDKENQLKYMYQTSWGLSTRIIGAMIMTHSDDHGLVLPPNIAPIKVNIIPIGKNDPAVIERSYEIAKELKLLNISCQVDDSEKSPGYRFAEGEMRGIPVRVEIGPRDLENHTCLLVRRDTLEKIEVSLERISEEIIKLLLEIQNNMYLRAKIRRDDMTKEVTTFEEMKQLSQEENGFIKALWCGKRECEEKIKEESGITSRCMPFHDQSHIGKCVYCQEEATKLVYWGKQY
ncbi:MAG: proline--tRNA ligase [bacterium]|nr:proline--tRNA ligase [bacterium]